MLANGDKSNLLILVLRVSKIVKSSILDNCPISLITNCGTFLWLNDNFVILFGSEAIFPFL